MTLSDRWQQLVSVLGHMAHGEQEMWDHAFFCLSMPILQCERWARFGKQKYSCRLLLVERQGIRGL